MTTPSGPTPSDRELLSAYLSDDLDEETANALEARLAEDPALAAELDGMAAMLAGLQGLSDVDPPPGYGDRLRARLATERAPEASAEDRGDGSVTDLGTIRGRRWPVVTSAAAALLLVVLVGAGVLGELPFGPQAQDAAAPDAGDEEQATEESAPERARDAPTEEQELEDGTAAAPEPEAAPDEPDALQPEDHQPGPVILDDEAPLPDEAAVRRRHDELPEVRRLLGRPLPEARETASGFRAAIADAPAFRSGARPGGCLAEVADGPGGEGPRVPARVETAVYAGKPVLAYVLVEPSPQATRLDRVVTRLVEPRSCEARAVVVIEERTS